MILLEISPKVDTWRVARFAEWGNCWGNFEPIQFFFQRSGILFVCFHCKSAGSVPSVFSATHPLSPFFQGKCSNVNFPNRTNCNRCQLPQPNTGSVAPPPGGKLKPGSWQCPNSRCNNVNFPQRELCNRCNVLKPQDLGAEGVDCAEGARISVHASVGTGLAPIGCADTGKLGMSTASRNGIMTPKSLNNQSSSPRFHPKHFARLYLH